MSIHNLPEKLQRYFSAGVLKEGRLLFQEQQVKEFVFFRRGYTGEISNKHGKTFTPISVLSADNSKFEYYYCTCSFHTSKSNLCSHIAALSYYTFACPEKKSSRVPVGNRFETSLWRLLGYSLFDTFNKSTISHNLLQKNGSIHAQTKDREGKLILEILISAGCKEKQTDINLFFSGYPEKIIKEISAICSLEKETVFSNKEKLLRKVTLTDHEEEMLRRGSKTIKQEWEESFWSHWCKSCFSLFGDRTTGFSISYYEKKFVLEFSDKAEEPLFKIFLFPDKLTIERMLNEKYKDMFVGNDFAVLEEKANMSFKIQFDKEQNLLLKPVLVPLQENKKEYHEIVKMKEYRFGKYYYIENRGFISLKSTRPFFPEKEASSQTSFNFNETFKKSATGVSTKVNTLIPKEEVLGFVQRHSKELSGMDKALVPPAIRRPEFIDLNSDVVFNFDSSAKGWCDLAVYYKIESDMISFYDLYQARKMGKKYLLLGNKWISTSSRSLQWLDDIPEKSIVGGNGKKIRLSPLEYLKLRFSMPGKVEYAGKKDKNEFFMNLEKFKLPMQAPALTELGMSLWDYQVAGYKWLWFLFQNRFGGLLCDDMGLGKTHQAMALIKAITIQSRKKTLFLIVCPTSVLSHWEEKLKQYCPGLQALLYHGPDRKLPKGKTRIVLTSYGTLRRDIHKFERYSFDLFVLDEIQMLKNKSTTVYQTLKHIKTAVSIGLTGTPIENSIMDLKNLLDFVQPGFLPGDTAFKKRFVDPIEINNNQETKHALSRMVYPFVLRRTKQQVLIELPEKIEDKRSCLLSEDQVKLYKDVINNQGAKVLELLKSGKRIPYIHIFAAMNYLKQICNHPAMLTGNSADLKVYRSGKWDLFCEILEECLNSKLKVVIFSQYVKMLKLIETYLEEHEIPFATIKGNTRNRKEMLDRFRKDPSCSVFTCSLKAGGLGIDLTAASVVIHYDRWWNQAREDQATDRVHRTGQKDGVQVIKFLTRGTLEEKIDVLIQKKQAMANAIVRPDDIALSKQFTRDELESLLTF